MIEISLASAAERLVQAQKIVLTAHIHPDGDALGSMIGLYHYLVAVGKKVVMLLDDDVPPLYYFLPGHQEIKRPTEQCQADLLVVLDASDEERIKAVKERVTAPVLNIDHHISNTGFADFRYLDSQAAATGEIVLQILQANKAELSEAIATCLYTAIATDCGFFHYANTTAATFRHAAVLVENGASPQLVSEQMEAKPLASVRVLGKVLDTLEMYANNQVACISLSGDLLAEVKEYSEGLINYPRNIEGVEIAIMFKAAEENAVRVSLRSRSQDVSRLALHFGGGGHRRAAGCTVSGSLSEAKQLILAKVLRQLQVEKQ